MKNNHMNQVLAWLPLLRKRLSLKSRKFIGTYGGYYGNIRVCYAQNHETQVLAFTKKKKQYLYIVSCLENLKTP